MKVIFGISELEASKLSNVITTLGSFDGVHIGHKRIISTMIDIGREKGLHPNSLSSRAEPAPTPLLSQGSLSAVFTSRLLISSAQIKNPFIPIQNHH